MRDDGRMKEKIELTLDTRQVVSIVLGAAVLLGIVFYLGVTVGKDLGAGQDPGAADPLGRLDQLAARADDALTFPDDLTQKDGAGERQAVPVRADATPTPEKEPTKPAPVREEAAGSPPVAALPAAAPPSSPAEAAIRESEGATRPAAPRDLSAALAGTSRGEDQGRGKPPADVRAEPGSGAGRSGAEISREASRPAEARLATFTVQVASLPNRSEADALASKLRQKGLSPAVTAAEIPGKGTFYRVRLGRFGTREEALRYLEDVRRETRLEGFVAALEG